MKHAALPLERATRQFHSQSEFPSVMANMEIVTNPFSTRFIRTGSLDFVGNSKQVERASKMLRDNHFVGQIIGPHGCGKSTLCHAIERHVGSEFESIRYVTLRKRRRSFSTRLLTCSSSQLQDVEVQQSRLIAPPLCENSGRRMSLYIIDGINSLPVLQRRLMIASFRTNQTGLLLTTHRALAGVAVIARLTPEFQTLERLVAKLAPDVHFSSNELRLVYRNNNGNIREALLDLYDRFEKRRHS